MGNGGYEETEFPKPFVKGSISHRISSGLLLRADVHQLFDKGYMTLTGDFRIEVSRRIKEEFENGKAYYALHGQPLKFMPPAREDRPADEFIAYHNEWVFAP